MPSADTVTVLVATDNHVGFNERDPIRGDDSWKSFHEIMCLAKERDVDMVLLAGDLFHENKPSRKSMYQVMRSIRLNCLGDRPCELELLSDVSEHVDGTFNHLNYQDMDINVAIPVFSIHGNHDDPTGEGHLAALDILSVSGLINYYGRTPESDNIHIKPILLQKGHTKIALYGLSNVRDERLFRTFNAHKVKVSQPGIQKDNWFNIMSVHQNHHAYTETSYLPEHFLPEFMDLVIWGHEHECLIDPRTNPQMGFKVMQPGSSVATSLAKGEAVPKHVSILSITGREMTTEKIRLKTVRPFVMKEIVLSEEKEVQKFAQKDNNRRDVKGFLVNQVEELIKQAQDEFLETHQADDDEEIEVPLPLVRLRVETSTADGGNFDCENPQRFSNLFVGRVANSNDVVQFYRKKRNAAGRRPKLEEEAVSAQLQGLDTVAVDKLVREYLANHSLSILPQNYFSDAVSQFIDKDDKHAMEIFVNEALSNQIKHLMALDSDEVDEAEAEEQLANAMENHRGQLEEMFAKGQIKRATGAKHRFKPKPDTWDSDHDGAWEDQPGALLRTDEGDPVDSNEDDAAPGRGAGRGRGRARGRGARGTTRARGKASAASGRGQREQAIDEEEDDDVEMTTPIDKDHDENSQSMFFKEPTEPARATRKAAPKKIAPSTAAPKPATKTAPKATTAASARQSQISFGRSQATPTGTRGGRRTEAIEIDDDDDDDGAFEPVAKTRRRQ